MPLRIAEIDAFILCGGLGSRLRSIIADRPKAMVEINHKPFLDYLIRYLLGFGIRRIILCTGYKSEMIKTYYSNSFYRKIIRFSHEPKPLGTAGGIKNAFRLIRHSPLLVLNGDSFCNVDLEKFLEFHKLHRALASIALTNLGKNTDVGKVKLDKDGRIISFSEKQKTSNGIGSYVNTGIYLFESAVFSRIPEAEPYSLEYDLFPSLKRIYGYLSDKQLFDIGTPAGYKRTRLAFGKYFL